MKYSKLPRIYVAEFLETKSEFALDADNYNYIKNVLRLKDGFFIRVYNERGVEYIARIKLGNKAGSFQIAEKFREKTSYQKEISLFISIIKADKFELICDMATQMGVTKIIPIISERVQRRELNNERLKKIITEAARQSERFDVPELMSPIDLSDIKDTKCEIVFFANETEENNLIINANDGEVGALIGPEGGFTDSEIEFLNSLDFIHSVSLGQNVLRAETAAIALLSKVI